MFRAVKATLVLAVDVTEHRKLEQQFRYAQKMEAIGRLAGGVAHDFNNLLMVIGSHAQLIWGHLGDPMRVDRYMQQIMSAIDRATLLTRQLLAFGRKQIQDLRILDLNSIVPEFCKMLPGLLGSDIEVVVRTSPRSCLVYSDKAQIELRVETGAEEAFLSIDGQVGVPVKQGDRVVCVRASHTVKLFRFRRTFFDVLRNKLKWGES